MVLCPRSFICKSERLIASEYFETLKTQKIINNTIFFFLTRLKWQPRHYSCLIDSVWFLGQSVQLMVFSSTLFIELGQKCHFRWNLTYRQLSVLETQGSRVHTKYSWFTGSVSELQAPKEINFAGE